MRRGPTASLVLALSVVACSRSGLYLGSEQAAVGAAGKAPVLPECQVDADCTSTDLCVRAFCAAPGDGSQAHCQTEPVSCDDNDICSLDRCDSSDGHCKHQRPADNDHDGVVGRALAGLPASCGGDDCDDDNPQIFPGAVEFCDGKDNDCNGKIDDDSVYSVAGSPVLIAPSMDHSDVSGFAFDGMGYGTVYTHLLPDFHTETYFERLNNFGQIISGPVPVSDINADTYAGSLGYSGKTFLTAWADARQAGNYEVYATRFDLDGNKLQADLRLTNADDFSLDPIVRFTGTEFVVIYEDRRAEASGGFSAIYGRRLSEMGQPIGDEVRLTDDDENAQFAGFDVGESDLGLAYVVEGPPDPNGGEPLTTVRFRVFDLTLGNGTARIDLGNDGQEPNVRRTSNTYVVAWHTGNIKSNWGSAIMAASVDPANMSYASGPVTYGDTHAKHRSLVSLGDRVVLVWAATPSDAEPFELFYETFETAGLGVTTPRQLLVKSATGQDLVGPHAVRGPDGDLGVVYDEYGTYKAYFTRLPCSIGVK